MALYRHGSLMLLFGVLAVAGLAQQQGTDKPTQTVGSETHTWNGTLIDAKRTDCGAEVKKAVPSGACPVSMSTTQFGILLPDGKSLMFDEGGNAKAVDALRRSRKGSKVVFDYWRTGKAAGVVKARVTGTQTSDTLNVESVTVL